MPELRPLAGTLVIAIEQAVAAPMCTLRLADAGARVIKIERAEGETARHYDQAVHDTSAYFAWLNRGKESLVLDLKNEADLDFLKRLIRTRADVFVQNLAPGSAARLGLSAQDVLALSPRLIAVDTVGFGQDTPYSEKRAYDMLVQVESGLCAVTGTADIPVKVGVSVADVATGMNAHAAILEAMIRRDKVGIGEAIEIAMFDSLADWMNVPLLHHEQAGRDTPRVGLAHASIYPYRPYSCMDGDVVIVVQNPREWVDLCEKVLEKPELAADERFADNPSRVRNRVALDTEIEPVFRKLHREEAVRRLEQTKLAWGKVSTIADLAAHPALRRVTGTTGGKTFSLAASALHRHLQPAAVPALGEHTPAIRAEFG